jgi:hypothetical protein
VSDIAVVHTWATPGGTITFNSGDLDQYLLNALPGLDGTAARVVIDKVPFGDGAIRHPAWKDARYFQPEGSLLIQSTRIMEDIQSIRNTMEAALLAAYESTLNADSTWTWTPRGGSQRSLTVRRDAQPLEFQHVDNFQVVDFSFGLVATSPDW